MDCIVYGVTESQTGLNDFQQQAVLLFILAEPPDVRKRKCPNPHQLTTTLTLSPSALGSHHAWGMGSVCRLVRAP